MVNLPQRCTNPPHLPIGAPRLTSYSGPMIDSGLWRYLLIALAVCSSFTAIGRAQSPVPAELDPQSPLAAMPDIGVAWPDLVVEAEILADPKANVEIADERRYKIIIEGLDDFKADQLKEHFGRLSVLKAGENKPANIAQIERRARDDADLLGQLLRADGYFDALIDTNVETAKAGDQLVVTLVVVPGPLYRFSDIKIDGLDTTNVKGRELQSAFAVDANDPVDADDVKAAEATLTQVIASGGFPFAKIGAPEVVVDHDSRTATLAMTVETGGERAFDKILVTGNNPPFDAKHIAQIARFAPGERYDAARIDDLRRAIIATGLVSSVKLEPVPGAMPDKVDIAVSLEPAPMRTIAGEAGYGTGEGVRAEVSWTHRNLIKPEGAVTFRGVAGTLEQSLSAVMRQSNYGGRDRILNVVAAASNIERSAFDAQTIELSANLERQTNIIWQKKWTWSAGLALLATNERDVAAAGTGRQAFLIGAIPAMLSYDGSDDLLDPTRGFRLSGRMSPELSFQSGTFGYARLQVDASGYAPLGRGLVIAGRIRVGSILGSSSSRIAPSRRFYAGGGGSVRGYGYQSIGPRDAFNDPMGGRSLAEFSLEARIRFGAFGIVPFIDGGNISNGSLPNVANFRYGAGIGVRYHSTFGPIRIDLGTPINPQKGDAPVAVYVSLGQAF